MSEALKPWEHLWLSSSFETNFFLVQETLPIRSPEISVEEGRYMMAFLYEKIWREVCEKLGNGEEYLIKLGEVESFRPDYYSRVYSLSARVIPLKKVAEEDN